MDMSFKTLRKNDVFEFVCYSNYENKIWITNSRDIYFGYINFNDPNIVLLEVSLVIENVKRFL